MAFFHKLANFGLGALQGAAQELPNTLNRLDRRRQENQILERQKTADARTARNDVLGQVDSLLGEGDAVSASKILQGPGQQALDPKTQSIQLGRVQTKQSELADLAQVQANSVLASIAALEGGTEADKYNAAAQSIPRVLLSVNKAIQQFEGDPTKVQPLLEARDQLLARQQQVPTASKEIQLRARDKTLFEKNLAAIDDPDRYREEAIRGVRLGFLGPEQAQTNIETRSSNYRFQRVQGAIRERSAPAVKRLLDDPAFEEFHEVLEDELRHISAGESIGSLATIGKQTHPMAAEQAYQAALTNPNVDPERARREVESAVTNYTLDGISKAVNPPQQDGGMRMWLQSKLANTTVDPNAYINTLAQSNLEGDDVLALGDQLAKAGHIKPEQWLQWQQDMTAEIRRNRKKYVEDFRDHVFEMQPRVMLAYNADGSSNVVPYVIEKMVPGWRAEEDMEEAMKTWHDVPGYEKEQIRAAWRSLHSGLGSNSESALQENPVTGLLPDPAGAPPAASEPAASPSPAAATAALDSAEQSILPGLPLGKTAPRRLPPIGPQRVKTNGLALP